MTNVVSTFSGCGGSSLGYKRAGCKVLLAIDFEENAVKTYKMNFPENNVWKANIREITGKQILEKIGLKKGELDIFDGSPPCTPFSQAGKREKGWNKSYKHSAETVAQRADDLFFEYIRLVDELQPKCFIGENVQGMIIGKSKGYFNIILRRMKELDYNVRVFKVNAKDFEVPQSRPRMIFMGFRRDIVLSGIGPMLKTHREISFYKATKDLKNTSEDIAWASLIKQRDSVSPYLAKLKEGESISKYHPKGSSFSYRRIRMQKPCFTITTHAHELFHPTENRSLTLAEAKRCASFPDDFKFLSLNDGWIRIGNSVPPNLMKNVALYAKEILDNQQ